MPLYEYQCDACGNRFEVIQKFSDPPAATCPKCGSGPVQKLLSSPAIQFKGSGWYITDYARAGKSDGKGGEKTEKSDKTAAAGAESAGSVKSESSSDSKSESKAETKSASKPESKSSSA